MHKESLNIVGIGASAGGLEAIQEFFSKMPSDTGLAFVVVQHLSPDHKSMMNELLAKYSRMEISVASDGMEVKANHIYLIPPGKNLTIFHQKLFLTKIIKERRINLPIDIFFRSLAEDQGKNSIGIILSGTGSDGTLGIRAIKEAGGMVMVQDDQSAKFDGMPRSSIATGIVDYVLKPKEMPKRLLGYVKHPFINKTKDFKEELEQTEDALLKIIMLIKEECGVDFSFYKPNTLIRRIEKRVGINQINKIEEYISLLEHNPDEIEILYKDLLIGVTSFFRDKEAFDELKKNIIPEIFKIKSESKEIRVWTVACSTGEEAYSLAILFNEYMEENRITADVKIFATDLDKNSIEYAGIGNYPENIYSDIPPKLLDKYFVKQSNSYQVKEIIRRMVVFAKQNITKDPPFSKIDLITCRNLLIYLKPETQQKILGMFYFAINPTGYLFLGSSESISDFAGFKSIHNKWKLFKCVEGYQPEITGGYTVPLKSNKDHAAPDRFKNYTHIYEKIFSNGFVNQVLEKYLEPSVILDENYNIIQTVHDVNKFLRIPRGRISYSILKLAHEDLTVVINSVLRKTKQENREVLFENVFLELEPDKKLIFDIKANVIKDLKLKQTYYIVSFIEKSDVSAQEPSKLKIDIKSEYHQRLNELEKELQFTKENLQATVEELETSNEELQSSNEELIASNEELQSTNEELQSVNEELYTVNAEHQDKISQLTELNNDIDNLLTSTDIGTIFLDKDLSIRKITPKVQDILPIKDFDVGRSIKDLAVGDIYNQFISHIQKVLSTLKIVEKEIKIKREYWLVRILPYRTQNRAIEGVVINFIEITKLKQSQKEHEQERKLLMRILNNSPVAKTMVDKNGQIVFANKQAEKVFGLSVKDITTRKFSDHDWKIRSMDNKEIPEEELPFSLIMKSKDSIHKYKHYITRPDNKKVLLTINGAPMFDTSKKVSGAIFTIELIP
ncbi:MAG: PAS domain-containing protein [Bacteroidetes bacterium]|nr:PAS domain-containing protein [Bacteroidota bacterium]